jgi:hypothetical protein
MIGAIDIGGTKIAAGMVDHRGRVLARLEQPTAPERGFEDALARMTQMLREVTGDRIGGIGIGCTGPVDPIRGAIENASLLPGWQWTSSALRSPSRMTRTPPRWPKAPGAPARVSGASSTSPLAPESARESFWMDASIAGSTDRIPSWAIR